MAFDDGNVRWFALGDIKHLEVAVCDVDEERGIVDFLARFEADAPIVLHRHLAQTNTLVLSGEHRLYDPDGTLQDARPVGTYTSSPPGGTHRECGGAEPCVVFYSLRSEDGVIAELLDDDMSVLATLTVGDFAAAWADQKNAGARV